MKVKVTLNDGEIIEIDNVVEIEGLNHPYDEPFETIYIWYERWEKKKIISKSQIRELNITN